MKRLFALALTVIVCISSNAQTDSTFQGYLYNEEYKVFMVINFYENNVVSKQQQLFGELSGYFGHDIDARQWLFTSAKIINPKKAEIAITNDYGSEDLTATLRVEKDGSYTLKQESGSRMKIAVNRKWVKLPSEIKFVKSPKPKNL